MTLADYFELDIYCYTKLYFFYLLNTYWAFCEYKSAKHTECKHLIIQSCNLGAAYSSVFVKIRVCMFKNLLLCSSQDSGQ